MIRRKIEERIANILLGVDEQSYVQETEDMLEAWIRHMGPVGGLPDLIKQTRDTFKQFRNTTSHQSAFEKADQLHKDIGLRRQRLISVGKHKEASELEPVERRLFYAKSHHKAMFGQPPKLSIRRRLEKARQKMSKLRPVSTH